MTLRKMNILAIKTADSHQKIEKSSPFQVRILVGAGGFELERLILL